MVSRHARPTRRRRTWLAIAIPAGISLALAGLSLAEDQAPPRPTLEAPPEPPAAPSGCEDPARAAALHAARVTVMDDWAAHVQAQTDQQRGKNSKAETKAVWGETRARGPRRAARYDKAASAYRGAGAVGSGAEAALSALSAADAAVADWRAHLKAMADRRAGRMGSHHAQQKWIKAYGAAPKNIDAFRAAAKAAEKACEEKR